MQTIEEALLLVELGGALIANLQQEDAGVGRSSGVRRGGRHGRKSCVGHFGRIVADRTGTFRVARADHARCAAERDLNLDRSDLRVSLGIILAVRAETRTSTNGPSRPA